MHLKRKFAKAFIIFSILLSLLSFRVLFLNFKEEQVTRTQIDKLIDMYTNYENDLKNQEEEINYEGVDICGLLTFPKQNNFTVLLTKKTDAYNLRFAANYDETSSKFCSTGLSIIGGHRNDYLFGILQYLSLGEIILLTDNSGNKYTYRVTSSPYNFSYSREFNSGYVVDKGFSTDLLIEKDESVIKNNNLLLYTCYPFIFGAPTEKRFLIFCQQINAS